MNVVPRNRPDLQFASGAFAIVRGIRFLWRTPAAWFPASVPVLLCCFLCALSIGASIHYVPQLFEALWPSLSDTLGGFGAGVVNFLGVVAGAILGVFVAVFLTPPLSAPALERLVLMRERELGVTPRPSAGLWREFWCALQSQLVALAVVGPLLALLWIVTWLFPPSAVVTLPLKFVLLALLTAFSLLDYPLSLRGMALRERMRLIRQGSPTVLGFGAALAFLFALPLLPLILLPAAVAAAAEISAQLELAAKAS